MIMPDLIHFSVLFSLLVVELPHTFGGCQFPIEWSGRWFQSAIGHLIIINSTFIETKGECIENQGDKYILAERAEKDIFHRCIVIHEKHPNVLQYKESMVVPDYISLDSLCHDITGDAVLLSMFRAEKATPIPCPFKSPPYSFSYSRGGAECITPQSRVDSCTDEARLLLTYLACPDISGTESGVEELICLAKWKDGSTRYLVGKIQNAMVTSDEDRYRCYVYDRIPGEKVVYRVAQSGDATCNGVLSPLDGSKTMVLTRIETQHERCKFPTWVTNHHHWHSLDYRHSYHFSHKNATLKISKEHGVTEMRLVCHNIESNNSSVTLVAHATEGCSSGFICLVLHYRDNNVIQIQQSNKSSQDPAEACGPSYFDYYRLSDPVTLVRASELPAVKCSHPGRYAIKQFVNPSHVKTRSIVETSTSKFERCKDQNVAFSSLTIGCNGLGDTLEFQSNCPEDQNTAYYCHGFWTENSTTYIITSPVSRKSTDAKRYCFVFHKNLPNIMVQLLPESCSSLSNSHSWTFNLSSLGQQCMENLASSKSNYLSLSCVVSLLFVILIQAFR